MQIDAMGADIALPLERPLFTPTVRPRLADLHSKPARTTSTPRGCSSRSWWTRRACARRCSMHCATSRRSRCASCWMPSPLQQGLAELVAYLELAHAGDGGDALQGLRAWSTKPLKSRSAGRPRTQRARP
jgi:hypothetical protein